MKLEVKEETEKELLAFFHGREIWIKLYPDDNFSYYQERLNEYFDGTYTEKLENKLKIGRWALFVLFLWHYLTITFLIYYIQ